MNSRSLVRVCRRWDIRSWRENSVLEGSEVEDAVKEERMAWEGGGRREESTDERSGGGLVIFRGIGPREGIGRGLRRDVKTSRSVLRLGGVLDGHK